jgi:DNA-binding MarR family transcriptional regulator
MIDTNGTSASDGASEAAAAWPEGPPDTSREGSGDRENVAAALDELSGWGPKDRHGAFQRWHRGALSLVHLNVLAALEAEGSLSMSGLADTLDVSVASATGIVDRMERRGLVVRRHDTEDRRVVLVSLTSAGADVFRDLAARRREHLARLLRELSDDDLAAFLRGIRALRAARTRLAAAGLQPDPALASSGPDGSPDR